jgi:hypothetical protein
MPRARRLASTVVAAALAVSGLAACNRAPDVAVYFGDAKGVTEAQVQKLWDDSLATLIPDKDGKKVMPVSRQDIVGLLVEVDTLRELGRAQGFTATPVKAAEAAQSLKMTTAAPLVSLVAEFSGWVTVSQQKVAADEVTEADLRDIYTRIKATGALQGNPSFEQFASTITADQRKSLGPAVGLRNDINTAAGKLKIKFNPRYPAPTLPIYQTTGPDGNALTLIEATIGSSAAGAAPVRDLV